MALFDFFKKKEQNSQKPNRRTRQTLWEECTDANPKLSLNDT